MKKLSGKYQVFSFLIPLAFLVSTLLAPPAHAAVVSFSCPSGGGTYQVNNGTLTGSTGTCSGDLTLDSSVTAIDGYSLDSFRLTSLTIPSSVTTISGAPGSYGSTTLTSITVDPTNPNFSSLDGVLYNKAQTELITYPRAKSGTTFTIPSSVTSTRSYAMAYVKYLTTINVPDSLTTLGGQSFLESYELITINIGTGLSNIGSQDFAWIPKLAAINVDASNNSFASIDGVLYNKNISKLWAYPTGKSNSSYIAPNTVTSTGITAFGGVNRLISVDLSSVSTMEHQLFMSSTSIEEIILGNSLTSIPSQTFMYASGLKKLTLGTGLTTISSSYAFYSNTSFYCVIYSGSNAAIQNFTYPNGVVPVINSSQCLTNPTMTLSTSSESVIAGTLITGYTVTSSGGAIASYSISPAISNTPGLSFSTSTGLISGTPTTAASARTYTITATNAAGTSTQTFAITVNPALSAPAFTLSTSTISATVGTAVSGYTINSTGGTIATYSISPAISNTPGLTFSTSTGLISGTPTTAASAATYTITATNATSPAATRTFAITVAEAPVVYPPVPFLSTATTPKLNLKDGKLICTPGTHNTGFTLNGVVDASSVTSFTPTTYTYNLLINGVAQTSLAVTTSSKTASWSLPTATSGSLISCSVSVSANSLSRIDMSTDNSAAVTTEQSAQSKAISDANNIYKAALKVNSKAYPKALAANRTQWSKEIDAIRSNYYLIIDRIKASDSSKMISDATTAFNVLIAAKAKSNADYAKNKQESLASRTAADKAALDAKTVAIAKANAVYGTFIESIGFGVLAP